MPGPLEGIKVVEFCEVIAGPLAGMLLSDMGARVIKVEPPGGDPWRTAQPFSETESRPFLAYNRGKRDLTLDLTTPESRDVLARLIPDADVVLVNYRPDVAARLGVDYDSLVKLNPRLVYCENTSFGRQGPDSQRPGYDIMVQAMSGLMAAEGKVDKGVPQHVWSTPMVDTASGIGMAWCVCAALFARERTGKGQKVETTLLGTALALLGMRFVQVEALDREPRLQTLESLEAMRSAGLSYQEMLEVYNKDHPQAPGNIYYRAYQTADGAIALGCLSDPLRHRLLDTLGLKDIRFDADYDPTLPASMEFGNRLMRQAEEAFRRKTTADWLTLLAEQGIPAGPVRFVEELFDDPQVRANDLVADPDHRDAGTIRMVGPLARFSDTPLQAGDFATLGQHTDEILGELGFSNQEIQQWRQRGVVR